MNAKMIIEIIFIIAFLLMAYSFANSAVGRRKGDAQIIDDLKKENDLLSKINHDLQVKLDKQINDRAQRYLNALKLGGKTKFFKLNDEEKIGESGLQNSKQP